MRQNDRRIVHIQSPYASPDGRRPSFELRSRIFAAIITIIIIMILSVTTRAFCKPPSINLLNIRRRALPLCHPPSSNRRPAPKSLALPPNVTLPVIALLSTHPAIPAALRNAPTSFLFTALLSNITVLPDSDFPDRILRLAPAALTLLLLNPSPERPNPRLLTAFLLGTLGTTIGALIASFLIPNPGLAAAFAATYIGGSANFVAVADVLQLSKEYTAAAMSVDLAAMTLYFTALFTIASRLGNKTDNIRATTTRPSLITFVAPVLLTLIIVTFTNLLKVPTTLKLLLTTGLATTISSIPSIQPYLTQSTTLSTIALNLFFAALGATARLSAVVTASPSVSIFAAIVLIVHAIFLYLVGALWLRIPTKELLLASNANIGGASTAAAFAACLGWRSLVQGAVAVGTLGYVLGTPIALLLFRILHRAV